MSNEPAEFDPLESLELPSESQSQELEVPDTVLYTPRPPEGASARTKIMYHKMGQFIRILTSVGVVEEAARRAGWSSSAPARYAKTKDPDFARAWAEAEVIAVSKAETALRERALVGHKRIIVFKGEIMYKRDMETGEVLNDPLTGEPVPLTVNEPSDRMLELYLKAHLPDKYSERFRTESNVNVNLEIKDKMDLTQLTTEERLILRQALERNKKRQLEGGGVIIEDAQYEELGI